MALLTADDILNVNDLSTTPLDVPEWGGGVIISEMTAKARAEFETRIEKHQGTPLETYKEVIVWLVLQVLVDEAGKRLFKDSQAAVFLEKNSKGLMRLYDAALAHNALRDDDVDDLAKNLEATSGDDSNSD